MKKNYLSTAMPGLILSLASLILPPVGGLKADIFTRITAAPWTDIGNSRGAAWGDYDNDGFIDLFVAQGGGSGSALQFLYHNNHDGTFPRITQPEFLTAQGNFQGVAWGDYNNDGRPDFFLPQAVEGGGQRNILYRNDGGGTFTRVGNPFLDGTNSAQAAWGDYDNDGDLDLFVSCSAGSGNLSWPNLLYRNDGNDTFTSITSLPANDPENQGGASNGCNWGDYDNDGWLDLFVANRTGQNDYLYHNNGDGTFTKVLGSIAVNDGANTFGAAWGDYDNDGFLDLFVSNREGTNFLYHNNGNGNHWLEFRLIGTRSNRSAIGAKVHVHATINGQSFWQMREVPGGDGYRGQNSPYVHVGLGNATNADLVRIEWPSGTVQELHDVASGQFHTVTEPGGEPLLTSTRVNGQVQLTLTGKQGSRYDIGTSTDLANWISPLNFTVTVTNPDGTLIFPAPGETSNARRFFRAALK